MGPGRPRCAFAITRRVGGGQCSRRSSRGFCSSSCNVLAQLASGNLGGGMWCRQNIGNAQHWRKHRLSNRGDANTWHREYRRQKPGHWEHSAIGISARYRTDKWLSWQACQPRSVKQRRPNRVRIWAAPTAYCRCPTSLLRVRCGSCILGYRYVFWKRHRSFLPFG